MFPSCKSSGHDLSHCSSRSGMHGALLLMPPAHPLVRDARHRRIIFTIVATCALSGIHETISKKKIPLEMILSIIDTNTDAVKRMGRSLVVRPRVRNIWPSPQR
ncbi:hypothetical protein F5887DRAFT_1160645 [Amanita rubescens]|nr:hypothetical protein F5887DRAFT_1160645 [Amanita rubescens]